MDLPPGTTQFWSGCLLMFSPLGWGQVFINVLKLELVLDRGQKRKEM